MSDETSPELIRQELGVRLRELRLARDMTVEDVAGRLLCSASKISRMETGKRGASQRDVRDLCDIYQVEDAATREELMALAKGARSRRGLWELGEGGGSPEYADLENSATSITVCVSSIIPVLFQTEEYARAQLPGRHPDADQGWIDQRVGAYALRQRLLTRKDPPHVTALIDEAALHRQVGGAGVMRGQLDRLLRLADLPNVEILVTPFTAGAHVASESVFVLLEFAESVVGAIVYFEGLFGQRSGKRPEDIDRCVNAIRWIRRASLDSAGSVRLISDLRDR